MGPLGPPTSILFSPCLSRNALGAPISLKASNTCTLVFSKLRAKLGLKPLEVNAVKKGECGAEDGSKGGHWQGQKKAI